MRFWPTFIAAFHSRVLYQTLRQSGHYALGYSLKLVALTTFIAVVSGGFALHRFAFSAVDGNTPRFDAAVTQLARQLPTMSLHDGRLKTDKAEATTIRLEIPGPEGEARNFALAVIDTTGRTTPGTTDVPIVIDERNLYVTTKQKTEIHPLHKFFKNAPQTLIINRALIDEQASQLIARTHASLTKLYLVFGSLAWMLLLMIDYAGRLTLLVLLAGCAAAIDAARGGNLGFARTMAISAVSFTPLAAIDILSFVFTARGVSTPLLLAGGAVALVVALRAGRSSQAV